MSQALTETVAPVQESQPEAPAYKVSHEETVYLISRQRHVRCRLWYEVTPLHDGLLRYFLVGIQALE